LRGITFWIEHVDSPGRDDAQRSEKNYLYLMLKKNI